MKKIINQILIGVACCFIFGMVLHFGSNTAKHIWPTPAQKITVEHVPAEGYEFAESSGQ